MRVLIVTQYFWPESFLINDLSKELADQGHAVTVLTGKPNYPEGRVFPGYQAEGCTQENYMEDITVFRVPLRPRGKGKKDLVLNYLSFILNGVRYSSRLLKKESNQAFDVIFFFAPSPITSVIPAIYLKWRLKTHLAVWVQDLWPESLQATGYVKNQLVLKTVGFLVKGIYACSDTLLAQSKAFEDAIAKYATKNKIEYFPNCNIDMPRVVDEYTEVPPEIIAELEDNFCLVFAGNLGTAQSIDTVIHAAELLKDTPCFRLVLVGSGSMLGWIEEQKERRGLDNIVIAGRFPSSEMPQFFSRAGGLLVTLRDEEIFSYTVPSKVQTYLAAGKPIIAALNGEGARVIKESGAGLVCPAEDGKRLAKCVNELIGMPDVEREKLGDLGRQYFLDHFEMKSQARVLVKIFENRVNKFAGREKSL